MTKEEIYEENMRNEYLRTFLTGERQGPYTNSTQYGQALASIL